MNVIKRLLAIPVLWDYVQLVLGAMRFKKELYLSKLPRTGKLLDFGCADGHIAEIFSEFDYYGVDIDPVAIEAAGCLPISRHRRTSVSSSPVRRQASA